MTSKKTKRIPHNWRVSTMRELSKTFMSDHEMEIDHSNGAYVLFPKPVRRRQLPLAAVGWGPEKGTLALPRRGTRPQTAVDRIKENLDPLTMAKVAGVLAEGPDRRDEAE